MFVRHGNRAATEAQRRADGFGLLAGFRYESNCSSPNNRGVIVSCVDLADAKQEGALQRMSFN